MAYEFKFSLKGVEELNKKLDAISKDMKLKGGRAALRRAANVIAKQVKANAAQLDDPKTSEKIQKNVAVRFSRQTFKSSGDLKFRVGILGGARAPAGSAQERKSDRRRERLGYASLRDLGELEGAGAGNPGGDTYYWRFVEFGTEGTPAKPFMRPALRQSAELVGDTFINEYQKSIDRVLKKMKTNG